MVNKPGHDLATGHLDRCQVCGSEGLNSVIDLGHQAPCDSLLWPEQLKEAEKTYPLHLVRCRDCGLVQIDYVVAPEELFFPDYPYRSGITPTLVKNLRSTGPMVMERYNVEPGRLAVDIGSNDGTLLSGFRDAGMKVLGVEPTKIAKIAEENGIDTIQAFFTEEVGRQIVDEYGKAAVVTAANMFAHVARLGSLIRGVERLLDHGGLFVTESHYLADLIETVQYDSVYQEHLKYYSMRSIVHLFSYYDFTVIDVDRIPNYGGSIRVYAKKGKDHFVRDSVEQLIREEERMGVYDAPYYRRFVDRIQRSKFELLALLVNAHARGQRVAGIGSPGRASTLLNYCNIDRDLMPYIAEQSSSLKLGLYMPGVHIPIVDEERMFAEQPEYAVMLAWHYWEPIVAKLREKGLRSKIVLPLPVVEVLEP